MLAFDVPATLLPEEVGKCLFFILLYASCNILIVTRSAIPVVGALAEDSNNTSYGHF